MTWSNQRACEDYGAFLLGNFVQRGLAMLLKETFQRFLREDHCAAHVCFQYAHEAIERLRHEGLPGPSADGKDSHAQLQVLKGFVRLDVRKGLSQVVWRCVGRKGFDSIRRL